MEETPTAAASLAHGGCLPGAVLLGGGAEEGFMPSLEHVLHLLGVGSPEGLPPPPVSASPAD